MNNQTIKLASERDVVEGFPPLTLLRLNASLAGFLKGTNMRMNFWKRKSLLTPKEIQIQEIVSNLNRWTVEDRKEILTAVVGKVFPTMHLHKSPRKQKTFVPVGSAAAMAKEGSLVGAFGGNPASFESVHKKQLDIIKDNEELRAMPPLVSAEVMAHFDNLVNKGVYGGNK